MIKKSLLISLALVALALVVALPNMNQATAAPPALYTPYPTGYISGYENINRYDDTFAYTGNLGSGIGITSWTNYDFPTVQPGRVEVYTHLGTDHQGAESYPRRFIIYHIHESNQTNYIYEAKATEPYVFNSYSGNPIIVKEGGYIRFQFQPCGQYCSVEMDVQGYWFSVPAATPPGGKPAATPQFSAEFDGGTLVVDPVITFGDMGTTIAIMVLIAASLLMFIFYVINRYLP